MTLVDTSVWVDHFRNGNSRLQTLLHDEEVLIHPFVVGELSCGNLGNREEILRLLGNLPQIGAAQHAEVLKLVESNRLFARGTGRVETYLLASSMLSHTSFWTLDKRLVATATHRGITELR